MVAGLEAGFHGASGMPYDGWKCYFCEGREHNKDRGNLSAGKGWDCTPYTGAVGRDEKVVNLEQRQAYEYIGKKVDIKIDRPLGSKHPKHDFIYEVNYGYNHFPEKKYKGVVYEEGYYE